MSGVMLFQIVQRLLKGALSFFYFIFLTKINANFCCSLSTIWILLGANVTFPLIFFIEVFMPFNT